MAMEVALVAEIVAVVVVATAHQLGRGRRARRGRWAIGRRRRGGGDLGDFVGIEPGRIDRLGEQGCALGGIGAIGGDFGEDDGARGWVVRELGEKTRLQPRNPTHYSLHSEVVDELMRCELDGAARLGRRRRLRHRRSRHRLLLFPREIGRGLEAVYILLRPSLLLRSRMCV